MQRMSDTQLGRFASPDTDVPKSQGVQARDRYAYVNNNPLKYNDPTGHDAGNPGRGNFVPLPTGPKIMLPGWDDAYAQVKVDRTACAPTAIASGMSVIKGYKISGADINFGFQMTFTEIYPGAIPQHQVKEVNKLNMGVSATFTQGDRGDLLDNVLNGIPTVVSISWKDIAAYGHALLVIGYDPNKGQFIFMDPGTGLVGNETETFGRFGTTFDQVWLCQPNIGIPPGSIITLQPNNNSQPVPNGGGGGKPSGSSSGNIMQ